MDDVDVAPVMDEGTFERLQNQMKTPELSNCVAHTPPSKLLPKLLFDVSVTVQPAADEQSVTSVVPSCVAVELSVQPEVVWSAIWLLDMRLIPSMISISPSSGQFGPKVQKAGHTEHPYGM